MSMRMRTPARVARQHGFSLIEAMVTLLVLGLGLIGIAALQLATHAHADSSQYRSQAAALAQEMIEHMRVNYEVTRDPETGLNYDFMALPEKTRNCNGASKNCTPLQLRDHDIREWSARLNAALPGATASIATTHGATADDPVDVTIIVGWNEYRGLGTEASESFTFSLTGLSRGE